MPPNLALHPTTAGFTRLYVSRAAESQSGLGLALRLCREYHRPEVNVAQWLGQYSGNIHASRVAGAEALLRDAIAALRSSAPADRRKEAKSIRRLAGRLLSARVRFIKAKIVASEIDEARGKRTEGVSALRAHLATIEEAGVNAIFDELSVAGELDAREPRNAHYTDEFRSVDQATHRKKS